MLWTWLNSTSKNNYPVGLTSRNIYFVLTVNVNYRLGILKFENNF